MSPLSETAISTTPLEREAPAMAEVSDFLKIDMRVGTVVTVAENEKANKPAYVLSVDFGANIGIKTSSAQLKMHYQKNELIGRKVVAVVNFPPRRVAGVKSEVLILAAVDASGDLVLIEPAATIQDGARIA